MNFKRLIVGLMLLAAVIAGGWRLLGRELSGATTPTAEAKAQTLDAGADTVSAEGQLVPLRHAELAFQSGGQVAEILVQEWDPVTAGDPLLSLESTDQKIALVQAQADQALAEANLEAAQAGLAATLTGLAAAELNVTAAQVQLDLVQAAPSIEEIALTESSVAAAAAGVTQAAGNRDAALEKATDAQVQAAEAQLVAARAQLKPLQDTLDEYNRTNVGGDRKTHLEMQWATAVANVNAAQAALDELLAGATAAEWGAAQGAVNVASAQQEAAQAQLALLLAGARPEQVTVTGMGVEQARAAVAEAELARMRAETAVTQAQAGCSQAGAAVKAAQIALDRMTLTAPFDGRIANLPVELGQVVAPGMPVVVLADLSGWLVETTDLTELDVAAVTIGAPVEVEVDALPDKTLAGVITNIASTASLVRGDVTYVVTIRLDNYPNLPLRWGMTTVNVIRGS